MKKVLSAIVIIIVLLLISGYIESSYCHYVTTTPPLGSDSNYIKSNWFCRLNSGPGIVGALLLGLVTGEYSAQIGSVKNNFTASIGNTYLDSKEALRLNGWMPTMGNSFKDSAGDKKFSEIGWCGKGVDAICNVDFQKGTLTHHLNVQLKNNEWVVVGIDV